MSNLVDKYYNKRSYNCMDCIFHLEYPDPLTNPMYAMKGRRIVCAINMKDIVSKCHVDLLRGLCNVPKWCHFIQNYNDTNTIYVEGEYYE